MQVGMIMLWHWFVGLWLLRGRGEHREAFFKFRLHFGHISFHSRSGLSVLGDCLCEGVFFRVCVCSVHCYIEFLVHRGAPSFGDLEFILIYHVFAKNFPFFSVGRDDLVPSFQGFRVHSSAFGELDERVSDEVGLR